MTAVKIVILGFEPGLPGGTLQTPFYYKKWKWTSAGQTDGHHIYCCYEPLSWRKWNQRVVYGHFLRREQGTIDMLAILLSIYSRHLKKNMYHNYVQTVTERGWVRGLRALVGTQPPHPLPCIDSKWSKKSHFGIERGTSHARFLSRVLSVAKMDHTISSGFDKDWPQQRRQLSGAELNHGIWNLKPRPSSCQWCKNSTMTCE